MAWLKDAKPGRTDGGYTRLFGVPELGALISQVHATSITAGTELEHLVLRHCIQITDLKTFLDPAHNPKGILIASKRVIKECPTIDFPGAEPDFMIFNSGPRECLVVELKDGDTFDTKKAAGERSNLHKFIQYLGTQITWSVDMRFCCFNQPDKSKIREGFKNKISPTQAMTGSELCTLLGIDYEQIVAQRQQYQAENLAVFIERLLGIEAVKSEIEKQSAT